MNTIKLPILPLPNIVFYPNTNLPIYIEEPVYIRMIQQAVQNEAPIGIVMVPHHHLSEDPHGAFSGIQYIPHNCACGVGIPVILEETELGHLKVMIRGIGRAMIGQLHQNLPYPIFTAKPFDDLEENSFYQQSQIERLVDILNNWIDETLIDSLERENFKNNIQTIQSAIDYTSMFLINDALMRQKLLESNSLNQRIIILNTLLCGASPTEEDSVILRAFKDFHQLGSEGKVAH